MQILQTTHECCDGDKLSDRPVKIITINPPTHKYVGFFFSTFYGFLFLVYMITVGMAAFLLFLGL